MFVFERCETNSQQWVYTSPECPAPWVTQLPLIGLSRQVNRTFAYYSCGSSYKCTWGEEHLTRTVRDSEGKSLPSSGSQQQQHRLTLRSDSLTEDDRCASLYSLDSCSAHSLRGGEINIKAAEFNVNIIYSTEFLIHQKASVFPSACCFNK